MTQPSFWHERWRTGQIGFHLSGVHPDLARHWSSLEVEGRAVLVPLCGKSLDLLWLRARGHSVVGIELSPIALEMFCLENGVLARRRTLGDHQLYEAAQLKLWCGDFFGLRAGDIGAVAAVYDRAALVALDAAQRARYAEHLADLVATGTRVLLVSFEYAQQQMTGPPFAVSPEEVMRLYSPNFSVAQLDRRDILAEEPRLQQRGVTALFESCYHLVRL